MAKTYRPYVPEQDLLLPPSLREWLPEDHLAFCVSDLIDQLDLSAITKVYEDEERGYPPYHPVMLTKVMVYAYCVGVFSSRKIQRRLAEDVAFRVLAAGNAPDFRTIADFRKTHLTALRGFFEQVLQLAREMGAPRVGRVALDGSKIKANASKHKAMSYGRMREKQRQLREDVKDLLAQAEAADAAEDAEYGADRRGDELPAELQRRESRLQRIREAKPAVARQYCVRSKVIDVGVAGRQSTGDASRHQDGCCPPIGWGDASRPPDLLETLALRHQFGVLARSNRRFRPADRMFWLFLRWLWPRWREALVLINPATVDRWHRAGARRC